MSAAASSSQSRPAGLVMSSRNATVQGNNRGNNGAAGGSNKKMVIRPFKVQPKQPENFEDATWEVLRQAVVAVQSKTAVAISYEELYRAVENLCVHKMGARLYDRLRMECARHVAAVVGSLASGGVEGFMDPALFLAKVDDVWQDHCEHMLTIRNIFLYMDRSFVMQTSALQPIWDMGLTLFRLELAAQGRGLQRPGAAGGVQAAAAGAGEGGVAGNTGLDI